MSISKSIESYKKQKAAEAAAKSAAELKAQEEVVAKAKAEMQELTVAELVKQNAELKSELAEFKELFHRFSDTAMKNDAIHKQEIAELYSQIQEGHCGGDSSGFHEDME